MRTPAALVTLFAVLGLAAPAAAQIRQGDAVYIEDDDGSLVLYRRLDRPYEGDGRARFARMSAPDQDAYLRIHGPEGIPIVDRAAVVARSGGETSVAETAVGKPEEMAAESVIVAQEEPAMPWLRGRFGISALGGGTVGNSLDDPQGYMGGLSVRAGVQLGDWLAFYYQPTWLIDALDRNARSPADDYDDAFTLWNTLLVETTLFDWVSLAAGPSVDFYWQCEPTVQSQRGCADESAHFGMHGRASVNVGGAFSGQRGAVSLSFDIHPTWFSDDSETLSLLGGLGVELY